MDRPFLKRLIAAMLALLSIPDLLRFVDFVLRITGIATLPEDVKSLWGLVTEMSGTTSTGLFILGLLGAGYLILDVLTKGRTKPIGRPGMEPSTLIFVGFCVVAIGLVAIAAGIVLQRQKDAPILDAAGQYFEVPEEVAPVQTTQPRKKVGLTLKHQADVLHAIEKYRAWLNGPVLEVYKTGDGIFMEQSAGLKDFKSTLGNYRNAIVEMGKISENMQREYEYAPEVVGLSNWYYSDMYQATSDLINEIDRVLSKYDDNKDHLQNNLFNDRFRRTTSNFRTWIIENKEKLLTLKREYEAYEVGGE